jgi:hypothetical protein
VFALLTVLTAPVFANVTLPPASTTSGYVCRLLINEVPFPGEKNYLSEADTKAGMEQILHVLDGRLHRIPPRYRQQDIAAVVADDIFDVITAGGVRGQVDGFYRDELGRPTMVSRVGKRVDILTRIADDGPPGKFARLLNHAAKLSTDYVNGVLSVPDRFEKVYYVQGIPATGSAYSWMTDELRFKPGGNYLRIPDELDGGLGGNRFFTLRKEPK